MKPVQRRVRPPPPEMAFEGRTAAGLFRPDTRGDLTTALAVDLCQPESKAPAKLQRKGLNPMEVVAPESPRPREMMEGFTVIGADKLTADDAALHELLVSRAYEADRAMLNTLHSFPMAEARRFLGNRVERNDVRASLRRLKATTVSYGRTGGRRFEDVSLLESFISVDDQSDVIKYRLPEPLRELMASQESYAYVELAALPQMDSKFSSRLYRRLAYAASKTRWKPGADNTVVVSATVDELADWVGFPRLADGKVHGGKLKERFLSKIDGDFAAVRAFALEVWEVRGEGRGSPLNGLVFTLRLRAPALHTVHAIFKPSKDTARVGAADFIKYRVESRTFRRAAKKFFKPTGLHAFQWRDLWLLALQEAVSDTPLTEEFQGRAYRGARLLHVIDSRGPDQAAWGLFCEEADAADLLSLPNLSRLQNEADIARKRRIGWGPKPQAPEAAPELLTLENCGAVVIPLTCDSTGAEALADGLGGHPSSAARIHDVVLRYEGGEWRIGAAAWTEEELDAALALAGNDLDGVEEYLPVAGDSEPCIRMAGHRVGYFVGEQSAKLEALTKGVADGRDVRPSLRFLLSPEAQAQARFWLDRWRGNDLRTHTSEKWSSVQFHGALANLSPLIHQADIVLDGAISRLMLAAVHLAAAGQTNSAWDRPFRAIAKGRPITLTQDITADIDRLEKLTREATAKAIRKDDKGDAAYEYAAAKIRADMFAQADRTARARERFKAEQASFANRKPKPVRVPVPVPRKPHWSEIEYVGEPGDHPWSSAALETTEDESIPF